MSTRLYPSIFLLLVFMVACIPVSGQSTLGSSTQTPLDEVIMQTATARALEQAGSNDELETAYAKATALSQDTTAQADLDKAAYQATATAILPVLEELPTYGVNPLDGNVAWLHKPVTIDLTGALQTGYANDYPEITAGDFILTSDITWNTDYGSSGCGFMFRSNGNKQAPSQFMVLITRFANGTLTFSSMIDGNLVNTRSYYPRPIDSSFNWSNDSTNRLAVVARGTLIDLYLNGVWITQVDLTKPPSLTVEMPEFPQLPTDLTDLQLQDYQQQVDEYYKIVDQMRMDLVQAQQNDFQVQVAAMQDGFLGFFAMSESGRTVCKFSNAWLFLLKSLPTPTGTPSVTATPTLTLTPSRTPAFKPSLTPRP